MAKALGRRGGRARARLLSADQRRHIAALGGHARHRSLQIAQRIDANWRFAVAVRELGGHGAEVTRLKNFKGPLPGIYRDRGNRAKRHDPA